MSLRLYKQEMVRRKWNLRGEERQACRLAVSYITDTLFIFPLCEAVRNTSGSRGDVGTEFASALTGAKAPAARWTTAASPSRL